MDSDSSASSKPRRVQPIAVAVCIMFATQCDLDSGDVNQTRSNIACRSTTPLCVVHSSWLPRHEGGGVGAGFGVGKLLGSLVVLNDEAVDYLLWGVVDPFVG